MTSSTSSFTYPRNVLHKIVEPQWFPADPHENQSKLTALEKAEQEYANKLQQLVEAQPMHALPNLKHLSSSHYQSHHHNHPHVSGYSGSTKHGRRRKSRLSEAIGRSSRSGATPTSGVAATTTPTAATPSSASHPYSQRRPRYVQRRATSASSVASSTNSSAHFNSTSIINDIRVSSPSAFSMGEDESMDQDMSVETPSRFWNRS